MRSVSLRGVLSAVLVAVSLTQPVLVLAEHEGHAEKVATTEAAIAGEGRQDAGADSRAMFLEAARSAWAFAEKDYQPATGLSFAVSTYPFVTMWDIGSMLAAVYSAHELQIIDDATYRTRVGKMLTTLTTMRLYNGAAFNRLYDSRTGEMVDSTPKASTRGTGWSAIDIGRLLIWLKIAGTQDEASARKAQEIVERLDFTRLIKHGYLYGSDINNRGREVTYQEGRIGYEQYAAQGFALWGKRADKALNISTNAQPLNVLGQALVADKRGHDRLTSEPFVLLGLELGFDPAMTGLASRLLLAQEARYRTTDLVTLVSEDAIAQPPDYFYYYCVYANGRQFAIDVKNPKAVVDGPRWISAKAAFGFHALMPSAYTQLALAKVAPARSGVGWASGVFEADGKSTGTENINTAAVVLSSALYHMRGRALSHTPAEHTR